MFVDQPTGSGGFGATQLGFRRISKAQATKRNKLKPKQKAKPREGRDSGLVGSRVWRTEVTKQFQVAPTFLVGGIRGQRGSSVGWLEDT